MDSRCAVNFYNPGVVLTIVGSDPVWANFRHLGIFYPKLKYSSEVLFFLISCLYK
jgi:hypothetical protein